jgi:membrane associated rhomboid family serine protease
MKYNMGKLTWVLIILNVLIFELVFSMPESLHTWIFQTLSLSQVTSLEVWRWFTSLFLHTSASHLFFNMLGLYFFGKILEQEVTPYKFISIYFISGLIGNFAYIVSSPVPVVGASGCVFGLLGAAMLLNPTRMIHFYIFPLPMGLVAIIFILVESMVVYFQKDFGRIAHIAHIAGLVTGSIFAFFYDPKQAAKGGFVLGICIALLIFLAPVFILITGIGGLILQIIDMIIGFFLYGIANLISGIWF